MYDCSKQLKPYIKSPKSYNIHLIFILQFTSLNSADSKRINHFSKCFLFMVYGIKWLKH